MASPDGLNGGNDDVKVLGKDSDEYLSLNIGVEVFNVDIDDSMLGLDDRECISLVIASSFNIDPTERDVSVGREWRLP